MIFITGDVHCPNDVKKLNTKSWPEQKNLTKDDYLIVLGDMGIVWDGSATDKYWQKWFNDKPFTTLFIDGNHENHDMLNQYKVEMWNGGRVHKIADSVFHLIRGEIFSIEGKSFFALGGAHSHDKIYRTEGVSWWKDEVPNLTELSKGMRNLNRRGRNVDIVLTHDVPTSIGAMISDFFDSNDFGDFLDAYILNGVNFSSWYAGHLHIDEDVVLWQQTGDGIIRPVRSYTLDCIVKHEVDFKIVYDRIIQI